MERVVKFWDKLFGAGVESPSLEGFQSHGDVALGDTGQCGLGTAGNGWIR